MITVITNEWRNEVIEKRFTREQNDKTVVIVTLIVYEVPRKNTRI